MNEREAQNQGMYFVGNTADPWDEQKIAKLKELAQHIRKLGFRAVVVKSGAREWGGGDYVLYADKEELLRLRKTFYVMRRERKNSKRSTRHSYRNSKTSMPGIKHL